MWAKFGIILISFYKIFHCVLLSIFSGKSGVSVRDVDGRFIPTPPVNLIQITVKVPQP